MPLYYDVEDFKDLNMFFGDGWVYGGGFISLTLKDPSVENVKYKLLYAGGGGGVGVSIFESFDEVTKEGVMFKFMNKYYDAHRMAVNASGMTPDLYKCGVVNMGGNNPFEIADLGHLLTTVQLMGEFGGNLTYTGFIFGDFGWDPHFFSLAVTLGLGVAGARASAAEYILVSRTKVQE